MTKTLTEQLKNGTLKDGLYYIKDNDNILIGIRYCLTMTRLIDDGCPSFEVLAPVPSYDEYNELTQKVENLEWDKKEDDALINFCNKRLVKYHKEIAKLKEQLEEANVIIKYYADSDDPRPAQSYLEKWGRK